MCYKKNADSKGKPEPHLMLVETENKLNVSVSNDGNPVTIAYPSIFPFHYSFTSHYRIMNNPIFDDESNRSFQSNKSDCLDKQHTLAVIRLRRDRGSERRREGTNSTIQTLNSVSSVLT